MPSVHGFCLAKNKVASFIAEGYEKRSRKSLLSDGRSVGIGPTCDPRRLSSAYERRPPVGNGVGMSQAVPGVLTVDLTLSEYLRG